MTSDVALCRSCFLALSGGNGRRGEPTAATNAAREQTPSSRDERRGPSDPNGRDERRGAEEQRNEFLGFERKCPACGMALPKIRKGGYIGCAVCFSSMKNELIPIIDKMQNYVISEPEKKRKEMRIILLEDEYSSIVSGSGDAASARRLAEIEQELIELGVKTEDD